MSAGDGAWAGVQLVRPGPCPSWCVLDTGHDYEGALVEGGRPSGWWSRFHDSGDLVAVDISGHDVTVSLVAEELVDVLGDAITEPARVCLSMPYEIASFDAAAARAIAAGLVEVAGWLETTSVEGVE